MGNQGNHRQYFALIFLNSREYLTYYKSVTHANRFNSNEVIVQLMNAYANRHKVRCKAAKISSWIKLNQVPARHTINKYYDCDLTEGTLWVLISFVLLLLVCTGCHRPTGLK